MNLVPFDPFRLRTPFRSRALADLLFDDTCCGETTSWAPAVDIKEEEEAFVLTADVPGVDAENIDVTIDGGVLSIKGERKSEHTEEEKNFRRVERSYGSFERRFSFPDTVDVDSITAKQKDGVLEVRVPKKAASTPKKITVS